MVIEIIMFATMYPVVFLVSYIFWVDAKPRKNFFYGASIKEDEWTKPKLLEIERDFKKTYKRVIWSFVVIPFVTIVIPYVSIQITIWMLWIMALCVVIMIPFARANKKVKELKKLVNNYEDGNTEGGNTEGEVKLEDDDDKWLFGLFYKNPEDKRNAVSKRYGIGTTANLSRPFGKVSIWIIVISLVLCVALCVWVIFLEFTPTKLFIEENTLVAHQLKDDYRIDISSIDDLTLLDELPDMTKKSGTGMDELLKGTFWVKKAGTCQVFLNPENDRFIYFTSDDVIYYFGGKTDEETIKLYNELLLKINKE